MAYDAGKAFARIEDQLIDSMMRNLKRHLAEESAEDFDWSQWQTEQLRYLEEYRRKNAKKFGPQFDSINRKMQQAIAEAEAQGQKAEELNILRNLADSKTLQRRKAEEATVGGAGDAFFRVNDHKLDSLLTATQNDLQRAEYAVLRRADDQYRRIIFDAQMYANTGAGTVQQAVDMATKDFLSRGIDSIVYKNGSRHTISDYADMYIRTAERRAYLTGEGKKRQEWGEQLVIVNKRGGSPCPHCLKWVGKILIDDVYSGGKPDGKHTLLSEAMADGFLHPRCKDGFTTYFPGISSTPDPVTKDEMREAVQAEQEENREAYAERQAEKYGRLAKYSLDDDNKRVAEHRAEEWRRSAAGESKSVRLQEKPSPQLAKNAEDAIIKSLGNNRPRNIKLENRIRKCIESDRPIFADKKFGEYCRRVMPKADFFDVAFHGTPDSGLIFGEEVTPDIIANILKARKDYQGQNIRLLSCSTGKQVDGKTCFAQELADILGVDVEAPDSTLWVWPSGRITVGSTSKSNDGGFVVFKPRGGK